MTNVICSGALFYSTSTKRFLFLQRTDEKTKGLWGLVGGMTKFNESAFEGLKREIEEEKQAMAEFGSSDSGASLGDILGAALEKKNQNENK